MSNMGYCRFQNTLSDLQDCYDNMSEIERPSNDDIERLMGDEGLSREEALQRAMTTKKKSSEYGAFIRMVRLCHKIAEEYS